MAGCVINFKGNIADSKTIAVLEQGYIRSVVRPAIAPFAAALARKQNVYSRILSKLTQPVDVIGMNVSFSGGGYSEIIGLGRCQVAIDVPFGVDDYSLTGPLAADEIGVLSELAIK